MNIVIQHQKLNPIEVNLEEIKQYASDLTAKYKGLVYTEEQIQLAKKDRAYLNGLINELEEKRKQLKKEWNAPYLEVEVKLKEIRALIEEPASCIDKQVKDYETCKKDERRANLEAFFNKWNTFGEMISFKTILEDKWLGLSMTDKKATALLAIKLEAITKDLATLESVLGNEFLTECRTVYCQTLDLNAAISKQNILKQQKKAQEEILGAPVEEEPKAVEPIKAPEPVDEDIFAGDYEVKPEPVDTRRFAITASAAQFGELKRFCANNGIKLREVF